MRARDPKIECAVYERAVKVKCTVHVDDKIFDFFEYGVYVHETSPNLKCKYCSILAGKRKEKRI